MRDFAIIMLDISSGMFLQLRSPAGNLLSCPPQISITPLGSSKVREILPGDPGHEMDIIILVPFLPLRAALGLTWDDMQLSRETLEAIYRLEVLVFLFLDGDLTAGLWACFLWKEDNFSV